MRRESLVMAAVLLLVANSAFGNEKKKPVLPPTVLNARTAVVLIDPDAGISPSAPLANKTAQEDVEKALAKWGRLNPVVSTVTADLIIVIRKGSGKLVQPTIGGTSPNNRPVILQPNDDGIRIGGQKGQPPDGTQNDPASTSPHPQVEVGEGEDSFAVYDGTVESPLNRAPLWRYVAKNGLRSPDVPAVEEFRKALAEAEKQLQKQQQKKP
jgi:hypothetical protein